MAGVSRSESFTGNSIIGDQGNTARAVAATSGATGLKVKLAESAVTAAADRDSSAQNRAVRSGAQRLLGGSLPAALIAAMQQESELPELELELGVFEVGTNVFSV